MLECTAGQGIRALKNVTYNEPFFPGHFPVRPVMPGVLIIEALAQVAGILTYVTMGTVPGPDSKFYFVGIDKARFRRPVEPGDQLVLTAKIERNLRGIWKHSTVAYVGNDEVAHAELMIAPRHQRRESVADRVVTTRIDHRAVVSPRAELGDDVEVGPFAIIGDDVRIGARCWIGPHAVVNGPSTLGTDNRVYQFASLGDAPQDKKYKGEPTRLEIGDRNVFREYCTVNRGTVTGNNVTRVGSDNMLLSYTHVGHDCVLGNNIVLSNLAMLGGHVELGDWVIMSAYAGAHQFSKIGAHAFIANNTAVTRDIAPYVLAQGRPAEPHSVNSEGTQAARFHAGADPQHPQRVSRAVPLGPEARGSHGRARGHARRCAGAAAAGRLRQGFRARHRALTAARRMQAAAGQCIALVAGEASGDNLGAALIEALRARDPSLQFVGVAGPRMRALGCEPLAHAEELSVMGLTEVIAHLPRLMRLQKRCWVALPSASHARSSASIRRSSTCDWRASSRRAASPRCST